MNPNTNTDDFGQNEDRLSNLPNDVLTGILSHLEMKEIVRSGILSNRWKSVWLSVPTLVLDQFDFALRDERGTDYDARVRFSNFVNEILIARKLPSLDNISLICCDVDHGLVKLWVQSAMERDVSKLLLTYYNTSCDEEDPPPCELTHNWFSYNKLVVLKLGGYVAPNFAETSSCFPSLKELELGDIYFQDCDSLPTLLSNCPILENMTIRRGIVEWERDAGNTGTLIITSRSLKRLTVFCQIDPFHIGVEEFKMVMDVPAVEYLYLQSYVTNEYVVKDLSSLVKAEFPYIDMSPLLEIFKCSPQLEILNLGCLHATDEYLSMLPELDVPSCLTMGLKTIDIDIHRNDNINMLRYLLMNSKVLERMTIRCFLDESSKLELCNVILESAANSVTWSDMVKGGGELAVILFSEPRI